MGTTFNFSFFVIYFSQTNKPIFRVLGQQLSPQREQLAALARWTLRMLIHGFATSWGGMTIVELGFAISLLKVALEIPRLLAEASLTLLDLANFLVAGSY